MKNIGMFLLILSLSIGTGTAQINEGQKEKDKAVLKEEKAKQKEKDKNAYLELINDKSYLLEANTLYGKYMNVITVSSSTNFIKVGKDQIVIQTAGGFYPGYNGLGGITIKGKITDYTVNENKNSINVLINFTSPLIGHGTAALDVSPGGYASARISDNWGGKVTFRGTVLSLENSGTFEGSSLF